MEQRPDLYKSVLTEGIILIVLGILAIVLPQIFAFGIEVVIGVLLIIAGLVASYRAFTREKLLHSIFWLAIGVIGIVIGILMLVYPWKGILALTIMLTIYFFLDGLTKLMMAARLRHTSYWTWYLLCGLVSVILAVVVWAGWPNSSYWLLGLLLGINFIFFGCARIALALSLRP
jgi:uncharacterized membrane protein HdeD (DUF308 family)